MRFHSRRLLVPVFLSACAALLALGAPAHAGDGSPFLMRVGTGGDLSLLFPAGALDPYTNMMSVSITPKRSGLCAVTGAFRTIQSDGPLQIALSTAPNTAGTGAQVYDNPNRSVSGAISDAFVVQKNVPITFYMNGRNLGSGNVSTENKHLWVICEQEKTPTLP